MWKIEYRKAGAITEALSVSGRRIKGAWKAICDGSPARVTVGVLSTDRLGFLILALITLQCNCLSPLLACRLLEGSDHVFLLFVFSI